MKTLPQKERRACCFVPYTSGVMDRTYVHAITTLIAVALFASSTSFAAAQSSDPCPNEGRISTGVGQDVGFPKGAKICPGDGGQNKIYGGCEYNPYDVLETRYKSGSNVQITPRTDGNGTPTGGIDSALACRLTKFLDAAQQRGCNPRVTSAYRSAQQQQNMCGAGRSGCAPAGKSCHQYGLAIDVSSSCIGWMRMAAPQFALVFPYYGDHIQCAEHPRAACSGMTQPCNGGVRINPDLSTLPHPSQVPDTYFAPPAPVAPTSGLSNQFRQALGMPQQPAVPASSQPTNTPADTLPQPKQSNFCLPEYKCSGNTLLYQNAFCATQVSQVCSAGCINGACRAATSTATSTGGTTGTNTSDNATATSAIDILDQLAGYTATSTEIATATPLQLILGLSDTRSTGVIQQGQQGRTVSLLATGSMQTSQIIGAQQTFTSGDLSGSPRPYATAPERTSTFAILENMKQVLLRALEYLRPFQISRNRADAEHASYTIE